MKKLHFLALLFIALFALSTPVYSQPSKLVGKWEIKSNSARMGTITFTASGSKGTFYAVDGSSPSVSNVKFIGGKFSFNVFDKNLKFDSLTFATQSQLKGFLIEGGAVGTTRKFAVVLTRMK